MRQAFTLLFFFFAIRSTRYRCVGAVFTLNRILPVHPVPVLIYYYPRPVPTRPDPTRPDPTRPYEQMPNGILTAEQLRFMSDSVAKYDPSVGVLDITTRMALQLRGVTLEDSSGIINKLYDLGLTSLMTLVARVDVCFRRCFSRLLRFVRVLCVVCHFLCETRGGCKYALVGLPYRRRRVGWRGEGTRAVKRECPGRGDFFNTCDCEY